MHPNRVLVRLALALLPAAAFADDWPAWRGPTGQGISREKDLPLHWGPERNVKWKRPLPAPGNSTPIVWKGKVFITQASERGRNRATLCVDRRNGEVLWTRVVAYEAREPTHKTNPYCSASPVTDGERVIVSHGSAGVHCYDLDGEEIWRRDLGKFDHIWGNASSPVIRGDLCLLNCGPGPRTFLLAVDKRTGKDRWQVDIPGGSAGKSGRESWTGSWSTPVVVPEGGRDVALLSYPGRLRVFEVATGKELWSCGGLGKLVYTSPLHAEGVVVAMSGFMGPPLGVKTGGSGDVTGTHRLWRFERAPQRIGSGVVSEGHIYIVNDTGVAECIELKTGKGVWKERLGGRSWSSVVLAGDRLYTADQAGNFFVLRAAPRYEKLARNRLGETTRASIAVSDGELFIRTYKHLWCIAEKKTGP